MPAPMRDEQPPSRLRSSVVPSSNVVAERPTTSAALGEYTPRTQLSWRHSAQRSQRGRAETLHSEAVANQSRVEGDGLRTAMARKLAHFKVFARNAMSECLTTGGDPFAVSVRGASLVRPTVQDHEDGSYSIRYKASTSGHYSISVSLHGVPLPGSPFPLHVLRPAPLASRCVLRGSGLSTGVAREPTSFEIEFVDAFGETTHAEELDVFVEFVAELGGAPDVTGEKEGGDVTPAEEAAKATPAAPHTAEEAEADLAAVQTGGGVTAANDQLTDSPTLSSIVRPQMPAERLPQPRDETAEKSTASTPHKKPPRRTRSQSLRSASPHAIMREGLSLHHPTTGKGGGGREGGGGGGGLGSFSRRPGLEPNERQQHMTLWSRRIASDGVTASRPFSTAMSTARASRNGEGSGPSYAHELASDPTGVAFAFGGVDPGTLHAKGRLVAVHTVHYSVGRAGRYRLHVGLRQQGGEPLPGSPFELSIQPNAAHPEMTKLMPGLLPLRGTVGEASSGLELVTSDKMGNRCLVGGAPVQVKCTRDEVETSCVDKGDGTYMLHWSSKVSGTYRLHVTIGGLDVSGSPTALVMSASRPSVERFETEGDLLGGAVAGKPGRLRIRCRDEFDNVCVLGQSGAGGGSGSGSKWSFGLSMLPASNGVSRDEIGVEEGATPAKGGKKSKEGSKQMSAAAIARAQQIAFESIDGSMPYEGSWVGDEFEMRYTAQEAGDFELHVWYVAEGGGGGIKQKLPSSPFALRVTEGSATASGSQIRGAQAVSNGAIPAGQEIILFPQLRDAFGNASSAEDGALTATLEGPDSVQAPLALKRLAGGSGGGLGAYEIRCEPHERGRYKVDVRLHGVGISDSPVIFTVVPGAPSGHKSRLLQPVEAVQKIGELPCEITLECLDRFGNLVTEGGATVAARALGPGTSAATVDDLQNGQYLIRFTQAAAGECKIMVRLDNVDVPPLVLQFKGEKGPEKGETGGGKDGGRGRRTSFPPSFPSAADAPGDVAEAPPPSLAPSIAPAPAPAAAQPAVSTPSAITVNDGRHRRPSLGTSASLEGRHRRPSLVAPPPSSAEGRHRRPSLVRLTPAAGATVGRSPSPQGSHRPSFS